MRYLVEHGMEARKRRVPPSEGEDKLGSNYRRRVREHKWLRRMIRQIYGKSGA